MRDMNLDAELLVEMLSEMLGTVDGAVLTTCAAEAEHQMGEATLDIACHMLVGKGVDMIEEFENLAIVLQEADDWLVEPRELLVRLIATGVMR